jgi:NAD+ kinase
MQIAVFGRSFTESRGPVIQELYFLLHQSGVQVQILEPFFKASQSLMPIGANFSRFKNQDDLDNRTSCMITIGGDGTLLESVTLIRNTEIPLVGINTGRLGFLTGYSQDEISKAVDAALNQNYLIEKRSVLQLKMNGGPFADFPYALNDITLHKKESSTMITVHARLNGEHLNSYWADGLIVASPTGSTGYSLSCGGPILMPESPSFVITPIAPHNLNVRPLVITDEHSLSIDVEVRGKNFLLALDSRSASIPAKTEITINKAPFSIRLARKPEQPFLKTLREKLMWGIDRRN